MNRPRQKQSNTRSHVGSFVAGQGAKAMCNEDAQKEVGALKLQVRNDKKFIEERHLTKPLALSPS